MQQVLADIFPAEVVLPDHTVLQRARAWVTVEGVMVAAIRPNGDVYVAHRDRHHVEPDMPPEITHRRRVTVHGNRGDVIINRGDGCGCGSPLPRLTLDEAGRL